ncbi:MAG: hypothetical protein QOJ47_2132 [Gaiellales bacterium]|jgi:hypothetical protein|nr:hypothetical protein [Gaiellales bacterium]
MSSSKTAAWAAIFFGVLAVAVLPGAVAAAQFLSGVGLLDALYVAVSVSVVLGFAALFGARRARVASGRSIHPTGAGPLRTARIAAWAGLYAGITSALALGVYGVLIWAQ